GGSLAVTGPAPGRGLRRSVGSVEIDEDDLAVLLQHDVEDDAAALAVPDRMGVDASGLEAGRAAVDQHQLRLLAGGEIDEADRSPAMGVAIAVVQIGIGEQQVFGRIEARVAAAAETAGELGEVRAVMVE